METLIGLGLGVLAGVASGVAGIGGGVVMIPAMVFLLGLAQATAQGTSLVAIVFTAVGGTVVNFRNRRVDMRGALLMGLGGVVAAQLGKELALALPQTVLQRLFGLFVLASGLRMGLRAWRARGAVTPR